MISEAIGNKYCLEVMVQKEKCDCQGLMLAALAVGVLLGAIGAVAMRESLLDAEWLKDWQTLIAGVLAAFAAVLVFYAAVYNDRIASTKREREARVLLPFSLSMLGEYLEGCFKVCVELYGRDKDNREALLASMPDLHRYIFDDVRILIRLSDKDISKVFSVIVADLHILNGRLREMHKQASFPVGGRPSYHTSYLNDTIYQIAYLVVVIKRFYSYSREFKDYDFSLLSSEEIKDVLHSANIYVFESKYDSLAEHIEDLAKRVNDPKVGYLNSIGKRF